MIYNQTSIMNTIKHLYFFGCLGFIICAPNSLFAAPELLPQASIIEKALALPIGSLSELPGEIPWFGPGVEKSGKVEIDGMDRLEKSGEVEYCKNGKKYDLKDSRSSISIGLCSLSSFKDSNLTEFSNGWVKVMQKRLDHWEASIKKEPPPFLDEPVRFERWALTQRMPLTFLKLPGGRQATAITVPYSFFISEGISYSRQLVVHSTDNNNHLVMLINAPNDYIIDEHSDKFPLSYFSVTLLEKAAQIFIQEGKF